MTDLEMPTDYKVVHQTIQTLDSLRRLYYILNPNTLEVIYCSPNLNSFLNTSRENILEHHVSRLLGYFIKRVPEKFREVTRGISEKDRQQGEIGHLPHFRRWAIIDNRDLTIEQYKGLFLLQATGTQLHEGSGDGNHVASLVEYDLIPVQWERLRDILTGLDIKEYLDVLNASEHAEDKANRMMTTKNLQPSPSNTGNQVPRDGWASDLRSYELSSIKFKTLEELNGAIDLLIMPELTGMPFSLPGNRSIIVPSIAVPIFKEKGCTFVADLFTKPD